MKTKVKFRTLILCVIASSLVMTLFSNQADALTKRSMVQRRHFIYGYAKENIPAHPCPSKDPVRKANTCPNYVVDHIVALACGGKDHPSNMQWQTRQDGLLKDKWERIGCKAGHHTAGAAGDLEIQETLTEE